MKFTFFSILFFSFFLICFSNTNQKHLARADGCNLGTDSAVNILLDDFIHSFNNKDSIFIQNNLISQSEYDSIIYYLKGYKVSCLTQTEEYYKVNNIYYEYNNYIINILGVRSRPPYGYGRAGPSLFTYNFIFYMNIFILLLFEKKIIRIIYNIFLLL